MGTPAHLACTLMLCTGAAKCDAVKLRRGHIRDGRLVYRRNKTRRKPEGIEINIPIHAYLAESLAHLPSIALTFLQTESGLSRSVSGLGLSMRKWCDKAGLPLYNSHGLRKAICRRIAEAGGTAFKIMPVSGDISLKEAWKYCEGFGRKGLAGSAIASLPSEAHGSKN